MRAEFEALYPMPAPSEPEMRSQPVEPDVATGTGSFLVDLFRRTSDMTPAEGPSREARPAEGEDASERRARRRIAAEALVSSLPPLHLTIPKATYVTRPDDPMDDVAGLRAVLDKWRHDAEHDVTNLRRILSEQGSLSVGSALQIAEVVLDQLDRAHREGRVHRDVNPENVVVVGADLVVLADPGSANDVTYVAPESIVRGQSDARGDVYATGVMLYEMLTGAPPFRGETPIQIAFQHVNSEVPAPSQARDASWLPSEVDRLVSALTAHEPDARPDADTARGLVIGIRSALDVETLGRRVDREPATAPGHEGTGSRDQVNARSEAAGRHSAEGARRYPFKSE